MTCPIVPSIVFSTSWKEYAGTLSAMGGRGEEEGKRDMKEEREKKSKGKRRWNEFIFQFRDKKDKYEMTEQKMEKILLQANYKTISA